MAPAAACKRAPHHMMLCTTNTSSASISQASDNVAIRSWGGKARNEATSQEVASRTVCQAAKTDGDTAAHAMLAPVRAGVCSCEACLQKCQALVNNLLAVTRPTTVAATPAAT